MNERLMDDDPSTDPHRRRLAHERLRLAFLWGTAAWALTLFSAIVLESAPPLSRFEGPEFWWRVCSLVFAEPTTVTAVLAIIVIALRAMKVPGMVASAAAAFIVAGVYALFTGQTVMAFVLPLLVNAHLFVERNRGSKRYYEGFVTAQLAQSVCNVLVALGAILMRFT